MKPLENYLKRAPEGTKSKDAASAPEEIFARRLAMGRKLLIDFHGKASVLQEQLTDLPECEKLKGHQGVGDFTGCRKPHGLRLEKERDKNGKCLLPYSPWQELKVYAWLKKEASSQLQEMSEELGYENVSKLETEILGRIDAIEGKKQNTETEKPAESKVEDQDSSIEEEEDDCDDALDRMLAELD